MADVYQQLLDKLVGCPLFSLQKCNCSWLMSQTQSAHNTSSTIPLTLWARPQHPVCAQPPAQHQLIRHVPVHPFHFKDINARTLSCDFPEPPIHFISKINLVLITSTLQNWLPSPLFHLWIKKGATYLSTTLSFATLTFPFLPLKVAALMLINTLHKEMVEDDTWGLSRMCEEHQVPSGAQGKVTTPDVQVLLYLCFSTTYTPQPQLNLPTCKTDATLPPSLYISVRNDSMIIWMAGFGSVRFWTIMRMAKPCSRALAKTAAPAPIALWLTSSQDWQQSDLCNWAEKRWVHNALNLSGRQNNEQDTKRSRDTTGLLNSYLLTYFRDWRTNCGGKTHWDKLISFHTSWKRGFPFRAGIAFVSSHLKGDCLSF